jgi:hypothetical protein
METTEKKTKRTYSERFACSCNGCRNYPTRPAEIWHESQITEKEKGTFYFTKGAMRFFSSRIVDFLPVRVAGEIDSLSVIVSSRYGYEGAKRYYEIVMLCPFGTINRETLQQFDTLPKARKEWSATIASFAPCECHGCILDREYA